MQYVACASGQDICRTDLGAVHIPNGAEWMQTGILRAHTNTCQLLGPDAIISQLERIECDSATELTSQHLCRSEFWYHWCSCRLSFLPCQDSSAIVLAVPACWHSASIQERVGWSWSDIQSRRSQRVIPRRCAGHGANWVWFERTTADIFLCQAKIGQTLWDERGTGIASFVQCCFGLCGLCVHAPA